MAGIFKGAKPVEGPVERATLVDLGIKPRIVSARSITTPQSLLLRADRVLA